MSDEQIVQKIKERLVCDAIKHEIERLEQEIVENEKLLESGECGLGGNVVTEYIWELEDNIDYLKSVRMEVISERISFSNKGA